MKSFQMGALLTKNAVLFSYRCPTRLVFRLDSMCTRRSHDI